MYHQIEVNIISKEETDNEETYGYIFNLTKYTPYKDLKDGITSDTYDIFNNKKEEDEPMTVNDTGYSVVMFINKYSGIDIKYLKKPYMFKYDIKVIKKGDNYIGIEFHNNRYISNKPVLKFDKASISETICNAFKYYISKRCRYTPSIDNSITLELFEMAYHKKSHNTALYRNHLSYMGLYQSSILKYEIFENTDNYRNCWFLPSNKKSTSNLFYAYQYVLLMLDNNGADKTFTNPKNQEFFGADYKVIPTKYKLKIRLFISKYSIYDTNIYRKATERNTYDIHVLERDGKIIGYQFGTTKYYIWKNGGNLSTYSDYNDTEMDNIDNILNAFKDALLFLFKIY